MQRVLIFLAKRKIHKIRTDDLFLIHHASLTRSQTRDKRSWISITPYKFQKKKKSITSFANHLFLFHELKPNYDYIPQMKFLKQFENIIYQFLLEIIFRMCISSFWAMYFLSCRYCGCSGRWDFACQILKIICRTGGNVVP